MMSTKGLVPFRTESEAREKGRNGGIKSGESRRRKKLMKEQMSALLSLANKNKKMEKVMSSMGIKKSDQNNQMALVTSVFFKAMNGNTNAVNIVRELVGERVQEFNIATNTDPKVKELQKLLEEDEEQSE